MNLKKKLILFLSFLLVLPVFAQTNDKNLNISFSDITLSEAIKKIEKESQYTFFYDAQKIDLKQRVSLNARNLTIQQAIELLLSKSNIKFEIKNLQIALYQKDGKRQKQETTKKLTGYVKDKNGEAVIGASIIVKETNIGTVTDVNGRFSLEIPDQSVLKISYIGYLTLVYKVGNENNLVLELKEDAKNLNEVVVIGYGSIRKSDLTGSVASIKASELTGSSPTLDQALIGHTPGVEIKQVSGAPGSSSSIRIRGVNSVYGGVDPLYVIDGYPASKDESINPADVQSIEVLKDAASAAIYGSRASGGVILITTKRGSSDKTKVEVDYQSSTQQLAKKIDMMNASEFRQLHQDGYNNAYFDYLRINGIYADNQERWSHSRSDDTATRASKGAGNTMILCPDIMATNYDTDWQDAIFSNASMNRLNFNVSGGREGSRYMFSVGYLDQNGIVAPSNHNQITSRLNMDFDINKRFSINVNSSMSYVTEREVHTDGLAFNDGVILNTLGMPSQYPVYKADGSYATGWSYRNGAISYNIFGGENPVALANEVQQYYTKSRYNINTELKYKLLEGLYAKVNAGTQVANQIYRYYRPAGDLGEANNAPGDYANLARSENDRAFSTDWLLETTLNFNRKFAKHGINAVAGYSMQKKEYDNLVALGQGYTSDRIPELSAAGATATDDNGTSATTDRAAWSLISYFSRVMYNYDNRYTLSATIRTDGCSRFGPENRWGIFPSVSGGWNLSNEKFFEPLTEIITAKLRASWGISGNNNISNYRYIPLIKSGTYNLGTATVNSYYPSGFTDLALGWEKTNQVNLGLDLGFFQNRLNVIANYYYSVTSDLLYQNSVSAITGSTSYWTNLKQGKVYNNGFDVQIDGALVSTKDWKWDLGFNVSINRNKVMGLSDVITSIGQRKQITHITKNGLPIGSFYGMVSEGLITASDYTLIQEDAKHQGETGYKLQGVPVANYSEAYIGDVKWKDVNGDGKITVDDRDVIGDNYPDFTFGLNTSLSWKNLKLSATFSGQYGADVINFSKYYIGNMEGGVNSMTFANNRYIDENNTGDGMTYRANRVAKNLNSQFSTYFVEDASFFRCSNLSLGYTIPKNDIFSKLNISNLYIYASADNLFTLTKYAGYNPDVDYNSGNLTPGIDFGTYPLSKTYSLGLKISF